MNILREPIARLGIMTLYVNRHKAIEELDYFKSLIRKGAELGLDVFIFTPEDIVANNKLRALFLYGRRWIRKKTPFPDLIYDRCRYQPTARFEQLRKFRRRYPNLIYLNKPLANKWTIHRLFTRSSEISAHLPETFLCTDTDQVKRMLQKHRMIYLKPVNGTGGRGILKITQTSSNQYRIEGRNMHRHILTSKQVVGLTNVAQKARSLTRAQRYVVQQGIPITLRDGRVHDYRVFIQKDGTGRWRVTGGAGRIGAARSITSNLHGGGKAIAMDTLLKRAHQGKRDTQTIRQSMYRLAETTAMKLEDQYGQLCELALDLAVSPDGRVWLLEVNPKPSRQMFARIGDKHTYDETIRRPLEYALWLFRQQTRRRNS